MKCVTDWRKNTGMQHYTINTSDLAEEDLENAGDYIAFVLLNPSAAENTVKGIREQVNKLQHFPDRAPLNKLRWNSDVTKPPIHGWFFYAYC